MCLFSRTVNRRLDEWVKLDQLDLSSVETDVDEKVEDKVKSCLYLSFLPFTPSSYYAFLYISQKVLMYFCL